MKNAVLAASLLALILTCRVRAADEVKPAPATAPAAMIGAGDADALKAATDKDAVVEGTVSTANWSRTGSIFFINFKEAQETKFSAVFFKDQKDAMDKAFDGDPAKALAGAKIQISGKIIDYKGKPEIKLDKPQQIKIIQAAAKADDKKDDAADKKDETKDKEKKD